MQDLKPGPSHQTSKKTTLLKMDTTVRTIPYYITSDIVKLHNRIVAYAYVVTKLVPVNNYNSTACSHKLFVKVSHNQVSTTVSTV